jgi:SAM-dependent methyltransferase
MQDTNLPAHSFDCIIDKGLMDSLLCGVKGSEAVENYIQEVERLLTPDGIFICITYGEPAERLKYLEVYDIDSPLFTPWYTDVVGIGLYLLCLLSLPYSPCHALTAKPLESEREELDMDDPNSMYFVYMCRMEPRLEKQKELRKKKQKKLAKLARERKRKTYLNPL